MPSSSAPSSHTQGLALRRPLSFVTGRKFFLLFLFLLADLIFYPYVSDTVGTRYYIFRTLGVVVILLSVHAVGSRKLLIFIALALAIPATLEHAAFFHTNMGERSIVNIVLSFAFDVFVIVAIFRRVYAPGRPTAETIFGAVSIYLLIGFTFARLYAIIAAVRPHAFFLDPATNAHSVPVGFDFIFFSFGSMTTLGAGGIVAVLPQVRSFSMIESIVGVLYLAVMISRLISAYRPNFPTPQSSGNAD